MPDNNEGFENWVFGGDDYILYKSAVEKILDEKKSKQVPLYEDPSQIINEKDAIFIAYLGGFFKKEDPRIVRDYFNSFNALVIDPKYMSGKYHYIFTLYKNINEFGELTDVVYTTRDVTIDQYHHLYSLITNDNKKVIIDENVILNPAFNKFYKEDLQSRTFVPINYQLSPFFVKQKKEKGKDYGSKYFDSNGDWTKDENKPITFSKTLGKQYTFGVEIETISGYLPAFLSKKIDYSSVHDGSLRHKDDGEAYGKEYVTGVLLGDRGLKHLKMLFNEISKRCLINYQCSNHFHIGNIRFSKENIVFMYYLYQKIQNEIFQYLPLSRRNNKYCRLLDKLDISLNKLNPNNKDYKFYIDYIYSIIIQILTDRRCGKSTNNGKNGKINRKCDHPKGHKCGYDHSSTRYCWVNLIPALLNTRGNEVYTIEFRMVNGGSNYFKNKNWLLICMALVDIVENHKQYILKNPNITLAGIINEVYGTKDHEIISFLTNQYRRYNTSIEGAKANEEEDYKECLIDENLTIRSL